MRQPAGMEEYVINESSFGMRVFYRIVRTNPPTEVDFVSHAALGRTPPAAFDGDPERLRSWERVSLFDSEAGARLIARATRGRLGRFIAEPRIPDAQRGRFVWERTGATPGYYDMDASAADLLACVVRVIPVVDAIDPRAR